jgi:hypothetical protein
MLPLPIIIDFQKVAKNFLHTDKTDKYGTELILHSRNVVCRYTTGYVLVLALVQ